VQQLLDDFDDDSGRPLRAACRRWLWSAATPVGALPFRRVTRIPVAMAAARSMPASHPGRL
jgi:hypothetical protein